jgi:hypothetical protein
MGIRVTGVLLAVGAVVSMAVRSPAVSDLPQGRVTLRRVPNGGIQPQVRLDAAGVLHLVYYTGDARGGDLYYVRSTDLGATFSAPLRVNTQPRSAIAAGTIRGGQLALGRGGRVHVAWNGSDAAMPRGVTNPRTGRPTAPFLYTVSNPRGTAFAPERNLMQATYDLDGGGDVAADVAGNVYGIWHANGTAVPPCEASRQVWIARSGDDGETFGPEKAADPASTGTCGCCGLAALATGATQLQVLYRSAIDLTNRDVYLLLSRDNGRTFRSSMVQAWSIGACPMSSMALIRTRRGVLGTWETADQVYLGIVDPERAAIREAVAAPGTPRGRKHPRLATTADGDTLMVWTEGTAWARGGSLAWQAFDASGKAVGAVESVAGVAAWSFGAPVGVRPGAFLVFY